MTHSTPMLDAGRCLLRPLDPRRDAPALFEAFGDPASMLYWAEAAHRTAAETEVQLARWNARPEDGNWAITENGGEALGRITLIRVRNGIGEIGIIMRPSAQGQGLASAAVEAVTRHGFGVRQMVRIFADIDADNAPSIRLFERCGYTFEARLRRNWITHIGVRDSLIYARFLE